ncbi:MAG TPA: outer membrane beta-barrel family protein [Chitinophagaceae bacterium]|nr:outer membrane beta-barrel family protein [Chitinophagaceae bacterium]
MIRALHYMGVALFFIFFIQRLHAQATLHGLVNDALGKPMPQANVLLLNAADSSLVKGMVTTATGSYRFTDVAPGRYTVTATFAGAQQAYTAPLVVDQAETKAVAPLVLASEGNALATVTVTAKKPLLEQKIDRLIINVQNSITAAGNTALEVLERSPGVVVDHQNNRIAMNGKSGVVLMLNGKKSNMSTEAAVQLLAGMTSGNIEKIELITTPPANLDAEGNAGYINIVLKENNEEGTNGSYTLSAGYSKMKSAAASFNFNHRTGKLNTYGDLSYTYTKSPLLGTAYNRVSNNGLSTETYFDMHRTNAVPNINGRLGVDYQLAAQTVVGFLLTGYDNNYSQTETNYNTILANKILDTTVVLSNKETNDWKSYSGNMNVQHNFKKESSLALNLDYIYYKNNQPVHYFSSYYNKTGAFIYDQTTRSGKKTPITFWVGALDYSKKVSKKISLDAGVKRTLSAFRNDISFHRLQQATWWKDPALSANYKLEEDYTAVYTSFNLLLSKKTTLKTGLRYEYTNSNLGTTETKNIVDRHYGNLFPTFYITHALTETSALNFSYSRRITRPTFNDLAPFTYQVNATTRLTGNPSLQPAIANMIKGDYTLKGYLFSLSYTREAHTITSFQPHVDSLLNKTVFSPENLESQQLVSLIFSVPVTVAPWWRMQYNVTGIWQQIKADYQKTPIQLMQWNVNLNASQTFTLPKEYSIELSGFYQSVSLDGIFENLPYGSLDAGVKKKLPRRGGSLVFNASNLLNTQVYGGQINLPDQNLVSTIRLRFTQRAFKLTYSRNFGKDKLKARRERSTGDEDEKGRVH